MTLLLFIAVLVALIVVHELGHFVVAKLSGMRVDEFGVGYPPRAWARKWGETEYSLNWLPFGGFVKIYGEDEQDKVEGTVDTPRAFGARPRVLQALVLVAGIAMNLFFAYLLITATLMAGAPRALSDEEIPRASNVRILIADVVPSGSAASAGIQAGDEVITASYGENTFTGTDTRAFSEFIAEDTELLPIELTLSRNSEEVRITATPTLRADAQAEEPRAVLGVAIATVGVVALTPLQAIVDGAVITWEVTKQTAVGLTHFFASVFTLSANLSEISGPVGIAGAVGSAGSHGLIPLMTITAIISINLALINILPLPALDGGRLLFVLIEGIIRRPIPASVGRAVNGAGFLFLILLMLVVTAHDVFKLFS